MAPLVEFYVSCVWAIKPYGVRQIISRLKKSGFAQSEFLFDQKCNWFQITCQADDERKIKQQLKQCIEEVEDEILDEDEDLVDEDGAVVKEMDNAWIGFWNNQAMLEVADFSEFRLPEAFEDLPHREVWERLNDGPLPRRLSDLLKKDQFEELQKRHNVIISHNHSLTEVYIGAESADELAAVKEKLDVLLTAKELKNSEPTHLLWTEAHKEKDGFEITVDTRFLANTDPALIAATFLDLGPEEGGNDYEILAEAITLRICRYDEARQYHISLIGPKLKARRGTKPGKRRYRIDIRLATRDDPYGTTIGPKHSKWIGPEKKAGAADGGDFTYGGGDVLEWLDRLEESYAVATPPVEEGSMDAKESEPSASDTNLISFDEPAAPVRPLSKPAVPSPTVPLNLLDADDRAVASLTCSMKPLKPKAGNVPTVSIPEVVEDAAVQETKPTGISRTAPKRNELTAPTSYADVATSAVARPDVAAAQLPLWFIGEVSQAVRDLVSVGPYLRGKVSLRADLGRILITGMDYSALAFNAPGSPSNGWKKDTLLRILNRGSRCGTGHGVTFTRMLTQEGDDIEFLLSSPDLATGKTLWKKEPAERLVYSFFCVRKDEHFFLDLEADEENARFNYTLRTKDGDKAPIWIHCTLRSHDARIIFSHDDTEVLEGKYGEFAKSFIDSFVVTLPKDNKPHIRIGVHKGFGVTVESMRIKTSFQFLSADEKSYFDITEVEETVMNTCNPPAAMLDINDDPASVDKWMFYTVDPKRSHADIRESEKRGMPTFWYEASIRSVAAEKEFEANQTMTLGEKAPWSFNTFAVHGVVSGICKPALRMVQMMDSVGAYNDNQQRGKLPLPTRGNDTVVPGANWVSRRSSREPSPSSSTTSKPVSPSPNPSTVVQVSAPPGVVVARAYGRAYLTPPATVTSPMPLSARTARTTSSSTQTGQNEVAAPAPGNTAAGVVGTRTPSNSRLEAPAGAAGASSTGSSDASRSKGPSFKPANQFW